MFSSDSKILESDSGVRRRMLNYGTQYEEVHIVLLNKFSLVRSFGAHTLASNVWVYPTNSYTKITAPFGAFFTALAVVSKMSFKRKGLLVTSQDPFEIGLSALCLSKIARLPFEVQIHTDIFSPFFAAESLKNRIRVFIAKHVLRRADQVRVVQEKIAKQVIERFGFSPSKVEIRPVAIDEARLNNLSEGQSDFLRRKYPEYEKTVLMVSRLTPEKNYLFALEVFGEVIKGKQNIGLIIVGEGPLKEAIHLKASEIGIDELVRLEGWQEKLGDYYRSATVFFHAAKYEGYGVVFKEAEYCRIPMVSSDVGIAGDIPECRVYPVGDKVQAVRLLSEVLTK